MFGCSIKIDDFINFLSQNFVQNFYNKTTDRRKISLVSEPHQVGQKAWQQPLRVAFFPGERLHAM